MPKKQLFSDITAFLFYSLQGRSLLAGTFSLLLLIFITINIRSQLVTQLDKILETATELNHAHRGVNAIKYPLLRIESQYYLYLLSFDKQQKKLRDRKSVV